MQSDPQLLIEEIDFGLVENPVIGEGKDKQYKIKGPFIECDIKNRNNRVYPRQVVEPQVEKYQALIKANRAAGELNHPQSMEINMENIAIKIEKLFWKDKHTVIGEANITSMGKGLVLRGLIDDGFTFGVSTRGTGTLKEGVVQNDYRYVCNDVVWEPSATGCMVDNIMETKTEWVLENGLLVEKQLEELQDDLANFKGRTKDEVLLDVFEKILNTTWKNRRDNE